MMAAVPAWVWVLVGAEILLVVCTVATLVWCQREIRKLEGRPSSFERLAQWSLLESEHAPETEEERNRKLDEIVRRIEGR